MTNREKYIKKASNEELAKIIAKNSIIFNDFLIMFGDNELDLEIKKIKKWLAQEANREKYIEKASDEELAKIIGNNAIISNNNLALYGTNFCIEEIKKWLSQDAI